MKVLVTGAGGFLGRYVVRALRAAGHPVRALVRAPAGAVGRALVPPDWDAEVQVVHADLQDDRGEPIEAACRGVDGVVHLAAAMRGRPAERYEQTLRGTANLFAALSRTKPRRLVLCSSLSVYDWRAAGRVASEQLPLRTDAPAGYAAAKLAQEQAARAFASRHGVALTIVRPGLVWGRERPLPDDAAGRRSGGLLWVIGPRRRPALVHAASCADAIRAALERDGAAGEAIDVVDEGGPSAWRFAGDFVARRGGVRIPVPLLVARPAAAFARGLHRLLRGAQTPPPSLVDAASFAELYTPRSFDPTLRRALLPSHAPLAYAEALALTHAPGDPSRPAAAQTAAAP